jgi:hypothetical protein
MPPAERRRAHVGHHFDRVRAQQIEEVIERVIRVADGPDRGRQGGSSHPRPALQRRRVVFVKPREGIGDDVLDRDHFVVVKLAEFSFAAPLR